MARCSSCAAEIVWARTVKNKPIPLDAVTVKGGNIELDTNLIARIVGSDMAVRRYVAHFVSCPQAREFRGARR